MKKNCYLLLAILIGLLNIAKAQTVLNVGAGQSYNTIEDAYNAIPVNITGSFEIHIKAGYNSAVENFPITLTLKNGASATNTIIIKPVVANVVISCGTTDGFIFDGAKYVTINGSVGGINDTANMRIINSSTTSSSVLFKNAASNNVITYCNISGASTTTGVISFQNPPFGSGFSQGCNNDTINKCIIHSFATFLPKSGVHTNYTGGFTSKYIAITNNCFFDIAEYGIYADASDYWTINNNHIFAGQQSYSAALPGLIGIYADVLYNTTISNNYIGGTGPFAVGTSFKNKMKSGINIQGVGSYLILNNRIKNIELNDITTFTGIICDGEGSNHIIDGNVIGDTSYANSVVLISPSGSPIVFKGIDLASVYSTSNSHFYYYVRNNSIGGITLYQKGNSVSTFYGITSPSANYRKHVSIKNNLIGSTTNSDNVRISSDTTLSQTRYSCDIYGINHEWSSGSGATDTILLNTISNFSIKGCKNFYGIRGYNYINNNKIQHVIFNGTLDANNVPGLRNIVAISGAQSIINNKINFIINNAPSLNCLIGIAGKYNPSYNSNVSNNKINNLYSLGKGFVDNAKNHYNVIAIADITITSPPYYSYTATNNLISNFFSPYKLAGITSVNIAKGNSISNFISLIGTDTITPIITGIVSVSSDSNTISNIHANNSFYGIRTLSMVNNLNGFTQYYAEVTKNIIDSIYVNGTVNNSGYLYGIYNDKKEWIKRVSNNHITRLFANYAKDAGGIINNHLGADTVFISDNIISTIKISNLSPNSKLVGILPCWENTGIPVSGGSPVTLNSIIYLNNNLISNLSYGSSSINPKLYGVYMHYYNKAFVYNNLIRLGIDENGIADTSPGKIIGIYNLGKPNNNRIDLHYNTIYVAGNAITASSNTYAYKNDTAALATNVYNNILWNGRTNTTGTAKHYTYFIPGITNHSSNSNIHFANGSGGVLGSFNSGVTDELTLTSMQNGIPGQFLTSIDTNPFLINPTGDSVTMSLSPQLGSPAIAAALYFPTYTKDYYYTTRSFSPTIGAIEFPLTTNILNVDNNILTIYPNPNNGQFAITLDNIVENSIVIIYNALGEEVHQQKIAQSTELINTELSAGVYLLKVISDKGINTQKIIIKK